MLDYEQNFQTIINSITSFSFEFDFEIFKKELEIQEVTQEEIEKLGKEKVRENFNSGIYKIRLPNGVLIDANKIARLSLNNNIRSPFLLLNPNFQYVRLVLNKDLMTQQIKKQIRSQIANNADINLGKFQKVLILEDIGNKDIEGYLDNLPIKTSSFISEGKFYMQSTCTKEKAIKMINEVIEEMKIDSKNYVKSRLRRDYKNLILYSVFISIVSFLWIINKQYQTLSIFVSNSIGLFLFLVPLVIMRLINHSFFDTLFLKHKAVKKYEKEFFDKQN